MAYIAQALRDYILTVSGVTALCSTRVYYLRAPQDTAFPYIRMMQISDPDDRVVVGADASQPRFQFDIVGKTYAATVALKEALRAALLEYDGTISSVVVNRIKVGNARDLEEDEGYFRITMDAIVEYTR